MPLLRNAGKMQLQIIKMKVLLIIALVVASLAGFAQVDSLVLKESIQKLDKALLEKDNTALQAILHKDLNFGHSNGWVQSKTDILNDFKTGKLVYDKIENNNMAILAINKKWATVRTNTQAGGKVN